MPSRRTLTLAASLTVAALLGGGAAGAHTGATPDERPTARISRPPEGPRGRITIRPAEGGNVVRLRQAEGPFLEASVVVENVGDGPLTVRRAGFLGGPELAPRSPMGVSASLERGRDAKLAPGQSRTVGVRWRTDQSRAAELVGFLEVESDSAAPGADVFDPPAVLGVVGDRRTGIGRMMSSALVLLPLLVAVMAALAGRVRALAGRTLARAAAGVFLVHAVLAGVAVAFVDPRLSSLDGNDGMQLLEHRSLPGGLAWSLGIDGAALPFVVATTLVILAAAVAGRRVRLHGRSFFAGLALLATSTTGALLALDVRLIAAFLVLAAPAAYLLVSATEDPRGRRAALGVAAIVLASSLVLTATLLGLAVSAGPGLDLARGRVDATWQIADLARVTWGADSRPLLGSAPAAAAWALGAVGLLLRALALSPLTARAVRVAPAPATTALVGTALAPAGLLLVRLGYGPGVGAAGTVATPLMIAGLVLTTLAIAGALRSRELVQVATATVVAQAGLGLIALASRTPQGIEGALAIFAWHGIAAALVVLVAASLRDRVATSDGARLGGLAAEMPRASTLAGLALLAAGGLPGLAGFWGPCLVLVGLVGRAPLAALAVGVLLVAQAVALGRAHAAVFGGPLAAAWRASKELEPFGGRFPDLRARELLGAAPLAAALVVLGLHPRVLLGASEVRALELHRRADPAGPTQLAGVEPARPTQLTSTGTAEPTRGAGATLPSCPSSTSSTSETRSSASDRAS